jgi:uncharacterized UPF0160 family protein
MNFFKRRKKLITHDGSFHADDVFACATLCLMLEKKNEKFKIIRTRDPEVIKTGDYVFDVGGIYDPETNRFDHHQKDFKEKRENGIIYSSFGLVWKKFGVKICGLQEVVDFIDTKLVSSIDAGDNGFDLIENKYNVFPYTIQDVLATFSPSSLENISKDEQFLKAFVWVKEILQREIKKTKDQIEITKIIQNFYNKSLEKKLIIIDKPKVSRHEIMDALQDFPEPLFIVYGDDEDWAAVAMRKEKNSFENRKDFPLSWAGLNDEKLQNVSGVKDAKFCHGALFIAFAKSKEGAIKLAQIALQS